MEFAVGTARTEDDTATKEGFFAPSCYEFALYVS